MQVQTLSLRSTETAGRRVALIWSRQWFIATALVLFDLLAWMAIYWGLVFLRGVYSNNTPMTWWASAAVGLFWTMITLYVLGAYNPQADMMTLVFATEYFLGILVATSISFLTVYTTASYAQAIKPSRLVFLGTFILAPILALAWRRLLAGWCRIQNRAREFLVIGGGPIARRFYVSYRSSGLTQELRFVSDVPSSEIDGEGTPPVLGEPLQYVKYLSSRVSGIIIAEESRNISPELTNELVRVHFERVPVYTLESFYDTFWQKVPVMALDGIWPLQKGFPLSTETPYTSIKRIVDATLASIGLVLLSPVFAIIGLIVRLESPGPVFFSQERVGLHKQLFRVFKFRTMYVREEEGSIYTEANDRRITRSGRWLRKMRLDELPQLWNVLIGDMSLIGPRAEWVKCVELYQDCIPSYHFRHLVRPGITGWAQVNYPYGANLEDAIQKLKYDLYYIRHYSLKLDAMIILKTIHVVFLAKGT